MRCIVSFVFFCCISKPGFPQNDTLLFKGLQQRLHYGFIIAHSEAVQNTAGSNPRGLEIETFKQRGDTVVWDLCHCYPSKGLSFSYFNFDTKVLGHGLTVAYFLEPSYRLGTKAQFRFRGSGGLTYLTHPHNKESNPSNMSYSSHIGGFLQLGVGLAYQVAPKWLVQVGLQYQHISNGGLKEPNKGINWPTASVGCAYFTPSYRLPSYSKRVDKFTGKKKPVWEAGLLFSAKQGFKNEDRSRTPLVGFLLQVSKQVGRTNALNAGLETYYDNALHQKLNSDSLNGSAYRAGLLAGHDFLLGRFLFSQQIGVYLFHRTPYFDAFYHRWAFRYRLNKQWMIGFGLKAHRHVADFIDIRLLYRIF